MSGPSSVPPPRLPGLAKCSPTRYALQVRESSWLRGFVARNGISQTELSECWELSTTSVQRILRGERPLQLEVAQNAALAVPRARGLGTRRPRKRCCLTRGSGWGFIAMAERPVRMRRGERSSCAGVSRTKAQVRIVRAGRSVPFGSMGRKPVGGSNETAKAPRKGQTGRRGGGR